MKEFEVSKEYLKILITKINSIINSKKLYLFIFINERKKLLKLNIIKNKKEIRKKISV